MYPFGYRMRFVRLRAYAKIGALPISGERGAVAPMRLRRPVAHLPHGFAVAATQVAVTCDRKWPVEGYSHVRPGAIRGFFCWVTLISFRTFSPKTRAFSPIKADFAGF
jgi:hypothetical protein